MTKAAVFFAFGDFRKRLRTPFLSMMQQLLVSSESFLLLHFPAFARFVYCFSPQFLIFHFTASPCPTPCNISAQPRFGRSGSEVHRRDVRPFEALHTQWLDLPPAEERHPRAHWQVSFMELAIGFEAYAGRQLPPAPKSRFQGGDMSLQEKAWVLRLITTLLGRSVGKESILPAKLTNSCKSLIPMGAGAVIGLEGRPLLTKPLNVWKHLQRLRKYGEDRWAQRQRQRQAKHRANGTKSKPAARSSHDLRRGTGHGARRKEEQRRAIFRRIFTPDLRGDQRNLSMWTTGPRRRSKA